MSGASTGIGDVPELVGSARNEGLVFGFVAAGEVGGTFWSAEAGDELASDEVGVKFGSAEVGAKFESAEAGDELASDEVGGKFGPAEVGDTLGSELVVACKFGSKLGFTVPADKSDSCPYAGEVAATLSSFLGEISSSVGLGGFFEFSSPSGSTGEVVVICGDEVVTVEIVVAFEVESSFVFCSSGTLESEAEIFIGCVLASAAGLIFVVVSMGVGNELASN